MRYAGSDMQNRDELSKLAGKLGGLPVLGCGADSPAAQAGIRYGDILLSVNGVPTPDWSAYVAARRLVEADMVVEIFRGGEHQVHRLAFERNEPVDPYSLLADLIDQRVLPTRADDVLAPLAEPESLPS